MKALIITGPTASGKTHLSEKIASVCSCEIINADVGQFYKPLSIGTAKPDLVTVSYKHHLFDLLDKPEDLSVVKYRNLVTDLVTDICSRGKIPVIVGGSLFYIKSLFFPPQEFPTQEFSTQESQTRKFKTQDNNNLEQISIDNLSESQQWGLLQKIDPERAAMIHPNDHYRIGRALKIWIQTGTKPSAYKPILQPTFKALIVYVEPEASILKTRICLRTSLMINPEGNTKFGWIEEAEALVGTEWEEFLKTKNLIGYTEIFDWIKAGKNKSELPDLISRIQIKTTQYAKRQRTFWKSFQLQSSEGRTLQANLNPDFLIQTMAVGLPDDQILSQILLAWNKFSNN
ncbi:MAG: tRNA (adenosine(37)-N6)-dimethylallyltransferase MiaA [bacterium]